MMLIGDSTGATGAVHVGDFTIAAGSPKLWIRHASGEGGSFSRQQFEAEVCPLHELTPEHVEQVFRFYGRMF